MTGKTEQHGEDRVVLVRGNQGAQVPPVPIAMLSQRFLAFANAASYRPELIIRNVVVTAHDEIIISLSADVEGAYFAVQEASFRWSGSRWLSALAAYPGMMPKNVWVASSDCSGSIGYGGDYLYLQPADIGSTPPEQLVDVGILAEGDRLTLLGAGVVTAVRRNAAAGYDAGYAPGQPAPSSVKAVKWSGATRSVLGPGIAWAMNDRGDIVGDNRSSLNSVGVPTLWHNGLAIKLSDRPGTAFAIADDGTIAGDIQSRGFIIPPNGASHDIVYLDSLVGGGWHIQAAYALTRDGDVLALASRSGAMRLVLLAPRR